MEIGAILSSTLRLYVDVARQSARACVRNWPVMLATPALMALLMFAGWVVMPMGMLGGLLYSLVQSACFSCYLFLIDEVTRVNGRATLQDFKRGFGVYFQDILSVLFVFWIGSLVLRVVMGAMPNPEVLNMALSILLTIGLNVVPELLYQGRSRSTALLMDSLEFVQHNGPEWFPPTILIALMLAIFGAGFSLDLSAPLHTLSMLSLINPMSLISYLLMGQFSNLRLSLMPSILFLIPSLFGFFFWMVFRGFLFRALYGSTRRSRAFRERFGR